MSEVNHQHRSLAKVQSVPSGNLSAPSERYCQCPDCKRFYREHDRLIREYPTLRHQQELIWTSLQSFRTLAVRVLEELHQEERVKAAGVENSVSANEEMAKRHTVVAELENINAYLFSVEALLERIFTIKLPDSVECKFREVAGELAPDPLNPDRLRLNRLLHKTPNLAECDNNQDTSQT